MKKKIVIIKKRGLKMKLCVSVWGVLPIFTKVIYIIYIYKTFYIYYNNYYITIQTLHSTLNIIYI